MPTPCHPLNLSYPGLVLSAKLPFLHLYVFIRTSSLSLPLSLSLSLLLCGQKSLNGSQNEREVGGRGDSDINEIAR